MSTLKIDDFKSKLAGGGARPNLFRVEIASLPLSVDWSAKDQFQFLCKTAQLPGSTVGNIEVPFRGRILKVAGDRTFDPWTITVINDTDFKIRHAFEQWMNKINSLTNNQGTVKPEDYMTDASVFQLGRDADITKADGNVLRSYSFKGIFPTSISPIDLSYETSDAIEEFTVDFQVLYFTAADGPGAIN